MWRFITLLATGVLLLLFVGETASSNEGSPGPPLRPQKVAWNKPAKGLGWKIATHGNVTTFDSVWLESRIMNSAWGPHFFLSDQSTPMLTIWRADQPDKRRTKELANTAGLQEYSIRRQTAQAQAILSFRADVRSYFGRLKPGKYFLQAKWRITGRFSGEDKPRRMELQSPKVEIVVHEVDFKKIRSVNKPAHHLRFSPIRSPGTSFEATSTAAGPMHLKYVRIDRRQNKPVSLDVQVLCEVWHPRLGWRWCAPPYKEAQKLVGEYKLEPGKSVRLRSATVCWDGDGIYRYTFQGVSAPFVVTGSTGVAVEK